MTAPEGSAAGVAGQLRAAVAEAGQLRAELARRDEVIAGLRGRVEDLEDRLDDLRVLHGGRRDAHVAARRQDRVDALRPDGRPLPSVEAYDALLPSRRATGTTAG